MEDAARAVKGAEAILSVSTRFSDTRTESFRVASIGFEGARVDTVFFVPAPEFAHVSGTLVRQIALLGGNPAPFVPACVAAALRTKRPGA